MATTLTEYLANTPNRGQLNRPVHLVDGDYVTFFFAGGPADEDRLDDLVTLYRSTTSGEVVGCKIKGVARLLSQFGDFGVVIADSKFTLGMLFIGLALADPTRRDQYEKYGRMYGSLPVEKRDSAPSTAA